MKHKPAFILGCLLTVPMFYFFFISIIKFESGSTYFFDAATPFLESTGISEPPRLHILILFGPVLTFLLSLLAVYTWTFIPERRPHPGP
jgi:hypothetical protein